MLRSNRPDTMRKKAILSLCLGSRLAWILNTNPLKSSFVGSTYPSLVSLPIGDGDIAKKASSSSFTPKLLMALPKKTGATCPDK